MPSTASSNFITLLYSSMVCDALLKHELFLVGTNVHKKGGLQIELFSPLMLGVSFIGCLVWVEWEVKLAVGIFELDFEKYRSGFESF